MAVTAANDIGDLFEFIAGFDYDGMYYSKHPENDDLIIGGFIGKYRVNEHGWPKSSGFKNENQDGYTDIHHLRPADGKVNGAHSNYGFDNGGVKVKQQKRIIEQERQKHEAAKQQSKKAYEPSKAIDQLQVIFIFFVCVIGASYIWLSAFVNHILHKTHIIIGLFVNCSQAW